MGTLKIKQRKVSIYSDIINLQLTPQYIVFSSIYSTVNERKIIYFKKSARIEELVMCFFITKSQRTYIGHTLHSCNYTKWYHGQ